MKKIAFFLILAMSLTGGIVFFKITPLSNLSHSSITSHRSNSLAFSQALVSAGDFYNLYRQARDSVKAGNRDVAITLLNQAIPHAALGPELGMIYGALAEIYRDLGDLQKELEYVELVPKYTMNEKIKLADEARAEEIKWLVAHPEARGSLSQRYPQPPIYGRPFKDYQEVLIAQTDSKMHLDAAGLLLRDKKYLEAIDEYQKAYYPNSADNAFVEYGLIKCYEALGKFQEALILIDYTLKSNNWDPKNVEEFQGLRATLLGRNK